MKNFFSQKIKIDKKIITNKSAPFVVAEVSANHGSSLKNIKDIIDKAKKNGADAIKFQTFDLNEMTLDSDNKIFKSKNYFKINSWNNRTLYNIYKEAQFPFKLHKDAFNYAKKKKIICFSSVFDEKSLKFLEKLKTPIYKIASLESLHFPLINKIKKTNKPLIISTGTLSLNEIKKLISFLKKIKFKKIILCHCVSEYPVKSANSNLKMIKYLKNIFDGLVGYSDHTLGVSAAIISANYGARLIEKHFTNSKKKISLDSTFSSDPEEFKILTSEVKRTHQFGNKLNLNIYSFNKKFRRSIIAVKDIKKDEKFTSENIKILRPNAGIEPKYFDNLITKKSKKSINKGTPIKFSDF
tara:strand:+ start:463 stop:1524 length:1062 start_codon:yes stop_codon:yes gene_type:complete